MSAADSDDETAAASVPAPPAGAAALRRQLDAMAAERGLDRAQVAGGGELSNMPAVTPTAFTAIAGILDLLMDADARADPGTGTEDDA